MSHVQLRVDGIHNAEVALWEWLRADPQLRGRVNREQLPHSDEAMGAATAIMVTLASTGTLTALAHSVEVWLIQRRSDIRVTVSMADGHEVVVDGQRVKVGELERLLNVTTGQTAQNATPS